MVAWTNFMFFLREKYGLDSKQSCKFYKRTTGNVILDTQYKNCSLTGTPNPDAYSDSIFNNLIYKQGIYSSSDVNVDIYYDLVDIARINNPELDENSKNNLVKLFKCAIVLLPIVVVKNL